jgi:hypothetical protein
LAGFPYSAEKKLFAVTLEMHGARDAVGLKNRADS